MSQQASGHLSGVSDRGIPRSGEAIPLYMGLPGYLRVGKGKRYNHVRAANAMLRAILIGNYNFSVDYSPIPVLVRTHG